MISGRKICGLDRKKKKWGMILQRVFRLSEHTPLWKSCIILHGELFAERPPAAVPRWRPEQRTLLASASGVNILSTLFFFRYQRPKLSIFYSTFWSKFLPQASAPTPVSLFALCRGLSTKSERERGAWNETGGRIKRMRKETEGPGTKIRTEFCKAN